MAKHRPWMSWMTRLDWKRPYQIVHTEDAKNLRIAFMPGGGNGFATIITRRDARLLARRINQCLDETK